jgi:hypothetical protein
MTHPRRVGRGWTVLTHTHPGQLASQRVAAAAGLVQTSAVHNGEVGWISHQTRSAKPTENRHS